MMDQAFRDECELNIFITRGGAIEYQSILAKRWPGEDWDLLYSIIEDHIIGACGSPEDDEEGECINWQAVWKDWEKSCPH